MAKGTLNDLVNIPEAVRRARSDGIAVSEYAIRYWVRTGAIPARKVGRQILLFYPNLVRYLQCEDGTGDVPMITTDILSISQVATSRNVSNMEIRAKAKAYGVRHWQIAEALGIQESRFCKIIRHELSDETKADILHIIDAIAKEMGVNYEN